MNTREKSAIMLIKIGTILGSLLLLYIVLRNNLIRISDLQVQTMVMSIIFMVLSTVQISVCVAEFLSMQLRSFGIGGFISFIAHFKLEQSDIDFVYFINSYKIKILIVALPCIIAIVKTVKNKHIYGCVDLVFTMTILLINGYFLKVDTKYIFVVTITAIFNYFFGYFCHFSIFVSTDHSNIIKEFTMNIENLDSVTIMFDRRPPEEDKKKESLLIEEDKANENLQMEGTDSKKTPWYNDPEPSNGMGFSPNQENVGELFERTLGASPHSSKVLISASPHSMSTPNPYIQDFKKKT